MARLTTLRFIPASRLREYAEAFDAGRSIPHAATLFDTDGRLEPREVAGIVAANLGAEVRVVAHSNERLELLAVTGDEIQAAKLEAVKEATRNRETPNIVVEERQQPVVVNVEPTPVNVNVEPTPVTVENTIERGKQGVSVVRDRNGQIQRMEVDG